MSIQCNDIISFIEEFAPRYLAEEWDNVGLLVGSTGQGVGKVLVCLDVTARIVEQAVQQNIDLIISHHPVIFKPIKRLNPEDFQGRILYDLIQNKIAVYSAHTNLDVGENGVNEYLAEKLGLVQLGILNPYKSKSVHKVELRGKEIGLGKVGLLPETQTLENFISHVKKQLGIDKVRFVGAVERKIQKVAVFCGAFDGNWASILAQGADVLVTGDLKYHDAADAAAMGLCVVDAGHFSTEHIIVPRLQELLSKRFPELQVVRDEMEADPMKIC